MKRIMSRLHRLPKAIGTALLVASWIAATYAVAAPAGDEDSLEYSVKAAYLLKFGAFVEWPPGTFSSPAEPFVIGILGQDPFGMGLDQLAGTQTVLGRPIALRRFSRLEQARGVHLLYLAQSERDSLRGYAPVAGKNILTVGEADTPGVIVNFALDNNRVRFDINLDEAERAGLKLSSKLLAVARSVRSGRGDAR